MGCGTDVDRLKSANIVMNCLGFVMIDAAFRVLGKLALGFSLAIATFSWGSVSAQGMLAGTYDPSIPTLEAVAGHKPGEKISSPIQIVDYLKALEAADPTRVRVVEYARSWQGRPLVYAVIARPETIRRLDAVKADLARLASGAVMPAAERDALVARTPAVTWLGFGVHGDEITPSDSGLALAYHLLAAQDDALVDAILTETIVIIDPVQNPDGRARFLSSFNEALGLEPQADRYAAEHDQPWPGGRFNHYLMDMNRDWFALTQPETRGRIAALQEWHPVVFVDSHEMSGDETYFFPPAADPYNPLITQAQRQAHDLFGRNRGAWFDRYGIAYFTREVFDAFYPGYGDMWPTLNGAIAKTFEQGSPRGLVYLRRNGDRLTFREGVFNNFIAALATLDTVQGERSKLLLDFAAFRRSAVEEGERARERYYVIDEAIRPGQAARLAGQLAEQGIRVARLPAGARACERTYPRGALVIDRAQPAGRLATALLEPNTPLPADFIEKQEQRRKAGLDHELYDVTAWALPLMEDIELSRCRTADLAGAQQVGKDTPPPSRADLGSGFGYAVPWTDAIQAKLVFAALREGLVASSTDKAFTTRGRTFGKGTAIFPAAGNPADLAERLSQLAAVNGGEVVTLDTSWVEAGPNFGSASFARLKLPSIAIAWDEGTAPTSAGASRWVIEQKFGVAATPIRVRTLGSADLDAYDVLVLPETTNAFASELGTSGIEALQSFVARGGVLVALGTATGALAAEDVALLSTTLENAWVEEAEAATPKDPKLGTKIADRVQYDKLIADPEASPDEAPGALVRVDTDQEHWLSSGYDRAIALVSGSEIYTPLNAAKGVNVLMFAPADQLVASGYMWSENVEQLAYKPYLMVEPHDDGLVIAFTQSPTLRGYLGGLDLLLANVILLAPSRAASGAK